MRVGLRWWDEQNKRETVVENEYDLSHFNLRHLIKPTRQVAPRVMCKRVASVTCRRVDAPRLALAPLNEPFALK